MPVPAGWRYLTDEEAAAEKAAGNPDIRNTLIRDADKAVGHISEINTQLGVDVDAPEPDSSAIGRGIGFLGRQAAKVALPVLVGRGAGALGGLALSSPTAPTGVGPAIGTIGGAIVGGGATALGQEMLLNKLAEERPTSAIGQFVRASERDVRRHPYLSQAAQLAIGTPIGGGGLGVSTLKNALVQGGLQGAVETGAQVAGGNIDPANIAIATVGGALTSRPSTGIRARERAFLQRSRVPSRFIEQFAPAIDVETVPTRAPKETIPPPLPKPAEIKPQESPGKLTDAPTPTPTPIAEPIAKPTVTPAKKFIPIENEAQLEEYLAARGTKPTEAPIIAKEVKPTASKEVAKSEEEERSFLGLSSSVLRPLQRGISAALRPGLTRIPQKFGALGEKFKKKYEQMRVEAKQLIEPKQVIINKAIKPLSSSSKQRVSDWLFERFETGQLPAYQLTPEEQAAVIAHDQIQQLTGAERLQNGPYVRQVVGGVVAPRPFQPIPNYVNQTPNKMFWDAVTSGDTAEKTKVRDLFVNHLVDQGLPQQRAEEMFNNMTTIVSGKSSPFVEYAQLRTPEGLGLPKELRLNALDALQRQVNKHGLDISWHRNIESDPILGPQMGYAGNGRDILYAKGGQNLLGSDKDVRAAMQDYVGLIDPGAQKFETADRLVKTMLVQTPTQLWNIAQSGTVMGELMGLKDIPVIVDAVKGIFSKTAREAAIKRGSVRAGRNINPASVEDTTSLLNTVADIIQTATGSEALEKIHRTMFDSAFKQISSNRLKAMDDDFFNFWGPEDWQTWAKNDPERLTNYTTARMVESAAGGYSAEELPNWLLRGGGNQYVKPFFSLARWSVGRANHFIDNVVKPASKGNIGPLIGSLTGGLLSAEAVNWLKEELTDRKPREMTWDEYLNLGGEDTAYTLLSKANTAGIAGILGSSAFQLLAATKGEAPQGWQNPLASAATESAQRVMQFANAVSNGDVSFEDGLWTLFKTLANDRIQLVRILAAKAEPETGRREEAIAQRVGALPPRNLEFGSRRTSPFGPSGAYKREDDRALRQLIERRLAQRREVPGPTSALGDPALYQFINKMQGSNAMQSAIARDVDLTRRRVQTYRRAVNQ